MADLGLPMAKKITVTVEHVDGSTITCELTKEGFESRLDEAFVATVIPEHRDVGQFRLASQDATHLPAPMDIIGFEVHVAGANRMDVVHTDPDRRPIC